MNVLRMPIRFLLLLCLLSQVVGMAWAAPHVPPPPQKFGGHAIGNSTDVLWMVFDDKTNEVSSYRRWNPTSGAEKDYVLPKIVGFDSITATRYGLLFDSRNEKDNDIGAGSVWLATDDGKALTAKLVVPRLRQRMLPLADQSVLLIGGIVVWGGNGKERKFSNAVERVTYENGQLMVEHLPDLPGPARTAYGLIALPDGQVMVLGGSTSEWIGCSPCIADNYFLDVKAKAWRAGPPMNEARANPSLTLLPDGNVLIAGGWTPGHGDGGWGVTSRSTERWEPTSNRFVAGSSLPTGVAMHRAVWATGYEGKVLVLAGGNSAAIQTYDVAKDTWQVAAELCEPHETQQVFPFQFQGQSYLWLFDGKAGGCKEGRYEDARSSRSPRRLVTLRLGSQPFDPQAGITLNRNDFRFIPGDGTSPSYVVGGRVAGNNQQDIADAYAIWPEGRIDPISPAKVQYPPQIDKATLPPLNRERVADKGNYWDIAEKALPDGRAIVAGGQVQVHKIAIVTEQSIRPGTPDTYIGIGDYLPSRRHEIFEPAKGVWRNSAPSKGAGGKVAIFDDGRVVKLGKIATQNQKDKDRVATETEQYALEISSPDGDSWTRLDADVPPAIEFTHVARPFVIQNELFLSGQLAQGGSGGGPDIVQWLDTAQNRWETLWQIARGDNWRDHIGRIIVRTLPNGKCVVLPVGGF